MDSLQKWIFTISLAHSHLSTQFHCFFLVCVLQFQAFASLSQKRLEMLLKRCINIWNIYTVYMHYCVSEYTIYVRVAMKWWNIEGRSDFYPILKVICHEWFSYYILFIVSVDHVFCWIDCQKMYRKCKIKVKHWMAGLWRNWWGQRLTYNSTPQEPNCTHAHRK